MYHVSLSQFEFYIYELMCLDVKLFFTIKHDRKIVIVLIYILCSVPIWLHFQTEINREFKFEDIVHKIIQIYSKRVKSEMRPRSWHCFSSPWLCFYTSQHSFLWILYIHIHNIVLYIYTHLIISFKWLTNNLASDPTRCMVNCVNCPGEANQYDKIIQIKRYILKHFSWSSSKQFYLGSFYNIKCGTS